MENELMAFLHSLPLQEHYNEAEDEWQFADGSPCAVCTSSATMVAQAFQGRVIGYWAADEPNALVGKAISDGHDLALIADRWIVDYWA